MKETSKTINLMVKVTSVILPKVPNTRENSEMDRSMVEEY